MGVLYKYEPKQFEDFLPKEDKGSIDYTNHPLEGMFGKSEYEEIITEFIDKGVKSDKWPELELRDVGVAEKMADVGFLSRCSPVLQDPRSHRLGFIAYGTYMITNESLERVLEKGSEEK